ncbi:MAG: M20/M25/M40 family metallo-hydrolase [Candidatus Bipolaricaulota bacterium]|nr:M20/M25/M40 family metallo-hydrolase [Candidatus Bipolaricaulota bacterium]MDW8031742.1 M20/M25/M40 family metallo-hydrolase [Candidatus Bipolaricaulota bacterium]
MKRLFVSVTIVFLFCGVLGTASFIAQFSTATAALQPGDPLVALMEQVQEEQLREHICYLQSAEGGEACNAQGSRWSCDGPAIDRAVEYGRQYFEKLGLRTKLDPYSLACRPGLSYNVEAILPGADPQSPEIVLITAHLDSFSQGVRTSRVAPGADDNASGSAGVLEAARVLSQYKFKRSIYFVLFTGEEQGLVGSRAYAARLKREGANIVGVFNMDMIGYDSDDNGVFEIQAPDEDSYQLGQLLITTTNRYGLKLTPEVPDQAPPWSDHASFARQGYPAVLIIEDTELGESEDFNPYYHTTGDTLQAINLSYARRIVQALVGTVAQLAELAQ